MQADTRNEWAAAVVVLAIVGIAIGAALLLAQAEQIAETATPMSDLVTETATPARTQPVIILPTRTPQPATPTATASATPTASPLPTTTTPPTATPSTTSTPTPTATLTSIPTAATCAPPPAGWVEYIVQQGDNLYSLSRRYQTSVDALQNANCLAGTRIFAGQRLWMPDSNVATQAGPTEAPLPLDPTQAVITDPCSNPLAHISSPSYGAQIDGTFWVYGVANIPNFMRYEIDVRRDGDATWMHLGSDRTPVKEEDQLAQIDPSMFGSGAFWIRLTVVDKTYNHPPRCRVLVYFP